MPEIIELLEKYGLEYKHVTFDEPPYNVWFTVVYASQKIDQGFLQTIEAQAALMANTGLLIGLHGAGMENIIFMPRRSAVIEVFPYGIYCPLYTKIAATMQLQVSNDSFVPVSLNNGTVLSTGEFGRKF